MRSDTTKSGKPIYLCTVWERPRWGDPQPAVVDGRRVESEIVAENGGKARYRYWKSVREYWDVKLQDIRVKSLRSRKAHIANGWRERLETANAIVGVIAKYGRHFLSENSDRREPVENPFVSRFLVDVNREVYLHVTIRALRNKGVTDHSFGRATETKGVDLSRSEKMCKREAPRRLRFGPKPQNIAPILHGRKSLAREMESGGGWSFTRGSAGCQLAT